MLVLHAGAQAAPAKPNELESADLSREETGERLLTGLRDRVQKILELQIAVHKETVGLAGLNKDSADRARPRNQKVFLALSKNENKLVVAVTGAVGMLESEGSAAAVLEVLQQMREDMKRVQRRLEMGDVGRDTQAVEEDIIETLREMIESLKKG
jgi:hypothetical protein